MFFSKIKFVNRPFLHLEATLTCVLYDSEIHFPYEMLKGVKFWVEQSVLH